MGALRAAAMLALTAGTLCSQVLVTGRVVDENGAAVAGARLELTGGPGAERQAAVSDARGRFRVEVAHPGSYVLRGEREGFFLLANARVEIDADSSDLNVVLNHIQELTESIDVVYSPTAIDVAQTTDQRRLNHVEVQSIPFPASQDVRRALPMFAGVVQDSGGEPHINGGAGDQASYSLNGFNVADPVTGILEARISIETVRGLDLESGRASAAAGRGSAGSLSLETAMGDDRFRAGATNFIPSFSKTHGLVLSKWTPRTFVSGPIARGRAWFHNGFDAFYDVDTIPELPRGEDRSREFNASNLSRAQVNLRPSNILTASYLWNYVDSDFHELSFLSPVETTVDRRRSFNMAAVRNQWYSTGGVLVDAGVALTRTVMRDSPQGTRPFEITPSGYRGNYFADRTRHADRQQWTASVHLPVVSARGAHRMSLGLDLQRSGFEQATSRHEYRVLRADGSVTRSVSFLGTGSRRKRNFESSAYVQDHWTVQPGLVVELGARAEWDQIVRRRHVLPRVSAAWSPEALGGTKLAAGIGVFNDPLNLDVLTRHQDQRSRTQRFSEDGSPADEPVITMFAVEERALSSPRAEVLSISVEKPLAWGFQGKAAYMRRSGQNGLTFAEAAGPATPGTLVYVLGNHRRDRYDAAELTARRSFAGRYEWVTSYTYSRARSNAVLDYSLENPVSGTQAGGPQEWDAPHRFLSWGWAPVPVPERVRLVGSALRELTVSYLLETHTGFPFSVVNEENRLVGTPNQRRLPAYFNLNLHFEKKLGLWRYHWAWRFGLNNVTNHGNPNVVNNNIDSPFFLAYGRGQRRAWNMRLRFLGRR